MKRKWKMTAVLLSTALVLGGCGGKEAAPPESAEVQTEAAAVTVEVLAAAKGTIQNEYLYSGKAKPADEANVVSTVAGKVAKVNFDVGDRVQKGDVLLQMDTEDIRNSINTLKAQLGTSLAQVETAQTNLDLVNGASMQSQIEAAKSAVDKAELALNDAKTTYDNNKVLFESGVIAKADMDKIQLAYDNAVATYNQAKTSYEIVAVKTPEENLRRAQDTLNTAQAGVAAIQAQITASEKSLRDANVTSPITGIVTAKNCTEGVVLSQAAPAYTIINTDTIKIDVNVSEQLINQLSVGQEIDVLISAVSPSLLKASIQTINPAASASGTYAVTLEMPNGDGLIKSGMFAEVHFIKEKKEDAIVLPRDAVIVDNQESYVYVMDGDTAQKVIVTTGIDDGENIEIVSGVAEGDNVIVKGQTYVSTGDKVKLTSEEKKGE